jgi:hypothetical protein
VTPDESRLADLCATFAEELHATLAGVLPGAPRIVSRKYEIGDRYVVRPDGATAREQRIALFVGGERVAWLSVSLYLDLDRDRTYLKTVRSDIAVTSELDDTPLLRVEYAADMRRDPIAHWQVHAERGAFSYLLTRAHLHRPRRVPKPHDLSSVHLPVGGERFRPCVEDVLHLLVQDFGVDPLEGWEQVLAAGRERWRRRQVASAARDVPEVAARVLGDLGYTVTPPAEPRPVNRAALQAW